MSRGDSSMPHRATRPVASGLFRMLFRGAVDDHHLMFLEVVAQPTSRHEHAVGEFLVVRVPLLCRRQYLTEVVDWALDPWVLPSSGRSTTSTVLTTWCVAAMYSS